MIHSHASAQVFLRNLAALQSLNTLKAEAGVLNNDRHGSSFLERVTACQVPRADRGARQQRSACSPSAILLQCTYHVEKLHKRRTLAQYTTTTSQSRSTPKGTLHRLRYSITKVKEQGSTALRRTNIHSFVGNRMRNGEL